MMCVPYIVEGCRKYAGKSPRSAQQHHHHLFAQCTAHMRKDSRARVFSILMRREPAQTRTDGADLWGPTTRPIQPCSRWMRLMRNTNTQAGEKPWERQTVSESMLFPLPCSPVVEAIDAVLVNTPTIQCWSVYL